MILMFDKGHCYGESEYAKDIIKHQWVHAMHHPYEKQNLTLIPNAEHVSTGTAALILRHCRQPKVYYICGRSQVGEV